ncbi:GNAT family N-acetyltransferase [Nocardioides terrisoli]|uniref:GNAT family N-acetyltransferase n=1 Tax=Nocardioides terrisoli TaxID=3388267 RepID=UPI00287B8A5B|nr:GNAT family N-acetyltransferase [Nocardioides marmorisolisilvae]
MVRLAFTTDPATFLADTADWLSADPVVNTVVATNAEREARERRAGVPAPDDRPYWWLTVRNEAGAVVGAAMRTASFAPYPLFVLTMPDDATVALARALHARGEEVGGVNGARPTADEVAEEYARLADRNVEVVEHTRLFALGDLVAPLRAPAGSLRAATRDDVDLTVRWLRAFGADAAEQAGRVGRHGGHLSGPVEDHAAMLARIDRGDVWLWQDDAGRPVHLTGASTPSFGVSRIGPVYTPREHRGRGYASSAVAAVACRLADQGARVCLYADQANAVSTRLYQALGFRRVVDHANLRLEPAMPRARAVVTRPAPA